MQGPQALQQLPGLCITCRGRHIEPDQLLGGDTPACQLQRQPGQIGLENFCTAIGGHLCVLVFRPQAIAHTGLQSPGTASALGSTGAGDALGIKAGHAAARVKPRQPRQPGVDHYTHAVDGQAGLGNIGGQHHLALALGRRLDGSPLGRQIQFAMQGAQQNIAA